MRTLVLFMAVTIVMFAATPLAAQTPRSDRPYRGLFGGGVGNTEQSLTFGMTIGGGYDDNILLGGSFLNGSGVVSGDPRTRQRSTFGNGSANLAYSISRNRVRLSASLATSATYYPVLASPFLVSNSGGIGGTVKLWSGADVTMSQSATSSPLYVLPTFPTVTIDTGTAQPRVDDTLGVRIEHHVATATSVGLTQRVSKNFTMQFDGAYQRSFSKSHDRDFSTLSGGGGASVALMKGLDFRFGYHQTEARYLTSTGSQRYRNNVIDAGLGFNRALSLSRRTTLSFGTGTAAVSDGVRTRYFLTGNVNLNYEIGRSWTAGLSYSRNVGFVETFRKPVVSDSLNLGVGGFVGRRLNIQTGLGASTGSVGFVGTDNKFHNYYGTAGLQVGLSRYLGVGLDYSYYRYGFGRGIDLPAGMVNQASRQQARVFLTVSTPLFQRARRPNASR